MQEQASNHLKLLWSKPMVVSVEEKSWHETVAGVAQRDERKRTIAEASKLTLTRSKLGSDVRPRMSLGETCLLPKRPPA